MLEHYIGVDLHQAFFQACAVDPSTPQPVAPGHQRPIAERRHALTLPRYDRLAVLTAELKRMAAAGAPLALRLAAASPLTGARLASALSWV